MFLFLKKLMKTLSELPTNPLLRKFKTRQRSWVSLPFLLKIIRKHFVHLTNLLSRNFLKTGAIGYVSVPKEEYEATQRAANEPTVDEIKAKAKLSGLVAIPSDVYRENLRAISMPTHEELEKKSKKLGYTLILNDELQAIKRAADEPTSEELTEKAKPLGVSLFRNLSMTTLFVWPMILLKTKSLLLQLSLD